MKIHWFLLLFVLLLEACTNTTQSESAIASPEVFSEDSMKMLLFDLCLTEAMLRQKEREGKSIAAYSRHYYSLLLEKYHADTVKIKQSFLFYSAKPEELRDISAKVVDSLLIYETMLQKKDN